MHERVFHAGDPGVFGSSTYEDSKDKCEDKERDYDDEKREESSDNDEEETEAEEDNEAITIEDDYCNPSAILSINMYWRIMHE